MARQNAGHCKTVMINDLLSDPFEPLASQVITALHLQQGEAKYITLFPVPMTGPSLEVHVNLTLFPFTRAVITVDSPFAIVSFSAVKLSKDDKKLCGCGSSSFLSLSQLKATSTQKVRIIFILFICEIIFTHS
jgi:hypothetical protein